MLVDENGMVRHTKSINIFKIRHLELREKTGKQIMEIYGWKHIEGGKKHRYCFLRGSKKELKQMRLFIKEKQQNYPKK